MKKGSNRAQSGAREDSTVDRALALNRAHLDQSLALKMIPQAPSGVILEFRVSNKPPNNAIKTNKKLEYSHSHF